MEQDRLQLEQTMQRIAHHMQEMEQLLQWCKLYNAQQQPQQLHHGAPSPANTSTEHAPLAPASAGGHASPPQSPWQHAQGLSVAHKRVVGGKLLYMVKQQKHLILDIISFGLCARQPGSSFRKRITSFAIGAVIGHYITFVI